MELFLNIGKDHFFWDKVKKENVPHKWDRGVLFLFGGEGWEWDLGRAKDGTK